MKNKSGKSKKLSAPKSNSQKGKSRAKKPSYQDLIKKD